MSGVQLNSFVQKQLENLVVVTGFIRGGTSLVGKLVGTLQSVEYAFEPPVIPYLDAQAKQNDGLTFSEKELLKVYLYYDYFSNYLHGRKYNFRPSDDSCVFNMKTYQEVMEKWDQVPRMQDSLEEQRDQNPVMAFKFPSIYHLLPQMIEEFNHVRIIDIERPPFRVVSSLMDKGWFKDQNLGGDATGVWPFLDTDTEYMVPYLLREEDVQRWQTLSAAGRAFLITTRMIEYKLNFKKQSDSLSSDNHLEFSFEALLDTPRQEARRLVNFTGKEFGKKTPLVIDEIEHTECRFDIEEQLKKCEPYVGNTYREQVAEYRDAVEVLPL